MPVIYINLYKQGHYHRAGKPGTLSFHPGDAYSTLTAAQNDIDRDAPFIGTVPVIVSQRMLDEHALSLTPYPADSQPRPLRETRRRSSGDGVAEPVRAIPSHIEGMVWEPMPEWANRPVRHHFSHGEMAEFAPSKAYKPTHGGYPG